MNNRTTGKFSDTYLTPPNLIRALGEFDFDPCCPSNMPWRTAKQMIRETDPEEDGLKTEWFGRVWCNPPYSKIMPWVIKMIKHNHGIMLLPAKSQDTRWAQTAIQSASIVLFLKNRIMFCLPDGTPTTGKWSPNMLLAFGDDDANMLIQLNKTNKDFLGILVINV